MIALANPRVDGVLASADILEDLVLLGALDGKVAVGTMNRGGLAGAAWELDDRFTAYDADHLDRRRTSTPARCCCGSTRATPAPCRPSRRAPPRSASSTTGGMMAMVEPIPYTKDPTGKAVWDDDPDALLKAVGVCAALGGSSAYTWLKIQATADIDAVAAMTTQPLLILGGAPGPDPEATFASWERALGEPTVRGLVVGRALLYPADGDVEGAVGRAADIVHARRGADAERRRWRRRIRGTSGAVRSVTPDEVGWTYCGLRIVDLAARACRRAGHRVGGDGRRAAVGAAVHGRRRGAALRPRRPGVGVRRASPTGRTCRSTPRCA